MARRKPNRQEKRRKPAQPQERRAPQYQANPRPSPRERARGEPRRY